MANRRFNLAAFPSDVLDAPSFYRCMGPLAALRRQRPSLSIAIIENVNWATMAQMDGIMMQRPHTQNQLEICFMAMRHGLPIWVDHDDDVFNIPRGNPAYGRYMNAETHGIVRSIIQLADIVTCSTDELADSIKGNTGRPASVVPNALMTNIIGPLNRDLYRTPQNQIVYWRGSSTHQRDLDRYTPQMIDVASRNETAWIFHGIGQTNYALLDAIPQSQVLRSCDPLNYMQDLLRVRPKVMVVPLDDNRFNHAKSNIAWIEATFAGAICVAPAWTEWDRPGVLQYTPNTFSDVLDRAIRMPDNEQQNTWRLSASYIERELAIDVVNTKRNAVMDQMLRMRDDPATHARKRSMVGG